MRGEAETSLQRSADNERQLLSLRDQCAQQSQLLASESASKGAQEARLDELVTAEAALRGAVQANEAELAATTDDLNKMIRENQYLNEELQRGAREKERLQADLRRVEGARAQLSSAVDAKTEEKEEVLRSYRRQVRGARGKTICPPPPLPPGSYSRPTPTPSALH